MSKTISGDLIVFYVDDDKDDQQLFEEQLLKVAPEATLLMFDRGDVLLQRVRNPPPTPAIVFVDLNMPMINGFDIITDLKSSPVFNSIPLIVFSTSNDQDSFNRALEGGANYYIVKPVNVSYLRDALYVALNTDFAQTRFSKEDFVFENQKSS